MLLAVLILGAVTTGCSKGRQGAISQMEDAKMSESEAYFRLTDMASVCSGVIESAADSIITLSSDPAIQRRALMWKIYAIPVTHSAIFRIDPVIALLDVWTFSAQMTDYFETGAGKDWFGDYQYIAVDASRYLQTRFAALGGEIASESGIERGQEFVAQWSSEHPIDNRFFIRESTRAYWVGILVERRGESSGVVSSVETMTKGMQILGDRIEVYYEQLPKQARWQAQLFLEDRILGTEQVQGVLENIDVVAGFGEDIGAITDDIDRMDRTISSIDREFAALVDSVNAYWLTATRTLQSGMLEEIADQQRAAVMKEIESLSLRLVDESFSQVRRVVNSLVWVIVVLAILLLAGPFVMGYVTGRVFARRMQQPR